MSQLRAFVVILIICLASCAENSENADLNLFAENGSSTNTNKIEFETEDETLMSEDLGEFLESMLHDGERHVHSEKVQTPESSNSSGNTFDVDVELEALIHDGDGHVHDHNREPKESKEDGLLFKVDDPDHLLHDGDSHFHEIFEEALDGSRPITDSEPTLFDNPRMEQATIGTINAEDYPDYAEWKQNKEKGQDNGWFGGFSFISNIFRYNIESFKERYISTQNENSTKHDEG